VTDFSDRLAALAARIPRQTEHLQTEAATSTALVMPFIQALGYNVFDPTEVIPEFTADVLAKKGEKVDYAIMRGDDPVMLFEVKCWNATLGDEHAAQLRRYFNVTKGRIGILTNGIVYRFFTDLESTNVMDERPFLELNMAALKEPAVEELKRFTKDKFDVAGVVSAASELKYTSGIKRALAAEYASPSEDFVRFLAKQVYPGKFTRSAREQFTDIVKRAFQQFVNERLYERLERAQAEEEAQPTVVDEQSSARDLPPGIVAIDGSIVTTQEEVDGYNIVRGILASIVEVGRVTMRDTKSYCGVLLDDNNRKSICRLWFNRSQKYLGLFDAGKKEERVPIDSVADIYKFADRLRAKAELYEASEKPPSS